MRRYAELPENWEELTEKQATFFFKNFYYKVLTGKWNFQQLLQMFCDSILGKKRYVRKTKSEYYADLINQCVYQLDWMFKRNKENIIELDFDTIHNHFSKIKGMVGPDISELSFGEYRHSVAIFQQYNETLGDESLLSLFAGIMYRDKSKSFDRRKFAEYEKYGRKIPAYKRYYIYIWFMTFNQKLLTDKFTIDGHEICFSPIFANDESVESSNTQDIGLNSILFTLADTGTFGNADQTDNAPLFKVLLKLLYDKNIVDNIK